MSPFILHWVRYMQQVNLDFGIQTRMAPYEEVFDMSLARDALELAGPA